MRILLVLLVFLLGSCEEHLEEDLGEPVSRAVLSTELNNYFSEEQLNKIGVGERLTIAQTIQFVNQRPGVLGRIDQEVFLKLSSECTDQNQNTVPCFEVRSIKTESSLDEEGNILKSYEFEEIELIADLVSEQALQSRFSRPDRSIRLKNVANVEDLIRIDYYNMSISFYEMSPPDSIRELPNCGGIENCQIRVKRVDFDEILVFPQGDFKTRYSIELSPDTPWYARYLSQCLTYANFLLDGAPITQCEIVVDYQFATE